MKKVIALMMIAVLVIVAAVGVSASPAYVGRIPTDDELQAAADSAGYRFSDFPYKLMLLQSDGTLWVYCSSNQLKVELDGLGKYQYRFSSYLKYSVSTAGVLDFMTFNTNVIMELYTTDRAEAIQKLSDTVVHLSDDMLDLDGTTVFFPRTLTPEERLALAKEKAVEEMMGHYGITLSTLLPVGLAILATLCLVYLIGSRRWLMV